MASTTNTSTSDHLGAGGRAEQMTAPCCAFCTAGKKDMCLAWKRTNSIVKLMGKGIKAYKTTDTGLKTAVSHTKGAMCPTGMDFIWSKILKLGLTEDEAFDEVTKFFIIVEDSTKDSTDVPEEEKGTNPELCNCRRCSYIENRNRYQILDE
jgi:hypothetical protein